jgi:hypothetical protein
MVELEQPGSVPTSEDGLAIIQRARRVALKLKKQAHDVDRAREVPVESVRELHASGLLTHRPLDGGNRSRPHDTRDSL